MGGVAPYCKEHIVNILARRVKLRVVVVVVVVVECYFFVIDVIVGDLQTWPLALVSTLC